MRSEKALPSDRSSASTTEDGSAFHNTTNWIMSALLLGAAGLVIWYFSLPMNFDFDSPDFNPMVFVPVFLGAYGLYYFVSSLLGTLRTRKFGSSTLEIQGPTVRMGTTVRGVVRTPVELHPQSDYVIRLQCIETFTVSGNDGSRDSDRIRWEGSTRVAAAAVNSKEGIPFELTLPNSFEDSQPSTSASVKTRAVVELNIPGMKKIFTHNQRPTTTRWVLEITAPLEGIDYYAIFGVIVEDTYGAIR